MKNEYMYYYLIKKRENKIYNDYAMTIFFFMLVHKNEGQSESQEQPVAAMPVFVRCFGHYASHGLEWSERPNTSRDLVDPATA